MQPTWVGFSVQKSLNKAPFFVRFSLIMSGLSRDRQQIVKTGSFPPKFIIKVGMMASVGN